MKKVKYLLLFFSFIMLASCSDDEITEPQKPESKDVISLGYEGKQFDFKNFHYGKYTNEDRELIGFLAEAEIVIDDKHKNRVLFLFKTDFKNNVEFAGMEFTPFKPGPTYPHNVFAYGYQYIMSEHGSPFNIDLKRSEEHTSELQSRPHLVCRLLLEKKNILIHPGYSVPESSVPPAVQVAQQGDLVAVMDQFLVAVQDETLHGKRVSPLHRPDLWFCQ